jgi:large subunit ribosomal protein L10e
MALRKALTYSKRYAKPYTRVSRAKGKAYIKVVPNNKVVKYQIGNIKAYIDGKYTYQLWMISNEPILIRDTAIEAARQVLTKQLDTKLPNNYYLEVKIHPHHMLRNNKAAAGAGADRLSTGMSRAFGVIEGRAAIVKAGGPLYVVSCDSEQSIRIAREALNMARSKLPCATRIVFQKAAPIAKA